MSLVRTVVLALAALLAATGTHAQIAFRGAASAATDSIAHVGTGAAATDDGGCPRNVSPAMPAGLAGDVLVALVNSREDGATIAATAAWTRAYAATYGGGNELQAYVYTKVATGTNTAADPLTVTQSGSCGSLAAQVSRFRGVDPTQPLETSPIPAANDVQQNSGNLDTGTQTTTLDGSMLLVAGFINDDRTVAEGAGWSESFDSPINLNRDLGVSLHYMPQVSAGPASVSNWDLSGGGNDENFGVIFALRPAGLRVPVPGGTLANDVMIASIAARPCSGASGGACTTTITPPAGWTPVNSFDQTTGGGTGGFGNVLYVYRRVASAAEPADYTWRFGGTPVNNGAVGGITSFSGVDTTNPIVADAGQVTPLAPAHTAPSIDTGIESDTMLVGSFAANSSATWTPPGGMTEALDVASLPVPDALGLSFEVAYELRAAAGATGTRAAAQSSPPADDTGAAHLLALRPAVHHYAIAVLSATVANCDYAEVTITAHGAGHLAVNPPLGRIVTLSVSAGAATAAWQAPAVSGLGAWTPTGATATYAWPGTESAFTVRLRQSAVLSLTVNANDTFVSEDATEDTAISFVNSAFRISDGANAARAIGNQIAAKPSNTGVGTQSLFLQAIETTPTGACTSVFPSGAEVDINVGAQCNSPAACTQNVTLTTTSGTGSPAGNFVPAGAGTYPATIRFRFTTASAEAPFFFSYADAGQITLQFRHITAAPAVTIAGTSNAFVTRPFGLAFRGADAGTAIQHGTLPTSTLLAAAGDNFTMTLAAYRWASVEDDGTGKPVPGTDITDNGLTPNFASSTSVSATGNLPGVAAGALARGVGCAGAPTIAAGSWVGGAATLADWCYSETGNVFLSASAADYFGIAGFSVGGDSGLDASGAAGGYVGRFKPKHFAVIGVPTLTNRAALACASTFTYLNEGLSLGFTLEARNAQNVLTQNYTGAYAKLDLSTAANVGIGARSGATILTARVDNALAPGGSFTNGVANLTTVTGLRRASPDAPDGPYVATQFGIAPNDNDPNAATGVQMQSFDLDADGGIPGNDHFAVAPTTELRYGRLRLQNAYGPVSQALPIALEAQHWNGGAFVANAQDDCTSLARANIALSFTGAIAACDTFVQQASIALAAGSATLTLSAPGAGNTGTVLLAPQLGSAAGTYCPAAPGGTAAATASPAAYLLGRWDDAANPDADGNTAYDDKPAGQAGFGLYGSQPKNFIFFRENY
jgi:hypothetical protein